MKQLHVVGSFPVGTHTFILWQVSSALAAGHQVKVLAANTGNAAGYQMAHELKLAVDRIAIYANYRTSPLWTWSPRRLSLAVRNAADVAVFGRLLAERRKSFFCGLLSRPEIANTELVQAHFVNWAIEVGLPLARLLRAPCVVTVHGAVADTPLWQLRRVQEQADAIVVVSEAERECWIERTGSDDRLHRIWNGVPLGARPIISRETKPTLRLISICRLSAEKRLDDLIEAVSHLHRAGCDCTLDVFGEGSLRPTLESHIARLGLREHVRLMGLAPHTKVMESVAASDLLVHTSASEPFGLALIEAMTAGRPVVAARSNGAVDIVIDGLTGLLYPCGDIDALVDCIARLATDPALRARMGHAARLRVEQEFSLEAHMRNMECVWRRVLAGKVGAEVS